MAGIDDARDRYLNWWRGKYCRVVGSTQEFKKVVDVIVWGPPSYVYGGGELLYEDGTRDLLPAWSFRPRKRDVEVREGVCDEGE